MSTSFEELFAAQFNDTKESIDTIISLLRRGHTFYSSHLFENGLELRPYMSKQEASLFDMHWGYFQNHLKSLEFQREQLREKNRDAVVLSLYDEGDDYEQETAAQPETVIVKVG